MGKCWIIGNPFVSKFVYSFAGIGVFRGWFYNLGWCVWFSFLYGYWFSWVARDHRYAFFGSFSTSNIWLSSNKNSPRGSGVFNSLLTFCRCGLTFFVRSHILLRRAKSRIILIIYMIKLKLLDKFLDFALLNTVQISSGVNFHSIENTKLNSVRGNLLLASNHYREVIYPIICWNKENIFVSWSERGQRSVNFFDKDLHFIINIWKRLNSNGKIIRSHEKGYSSENRVEWLRFVIGGSSIKKSGIIGVGLSNPYATDEMYNLISILINELSNSWLPWIIKIYNNFISHYLHHIPILGFSTESLGEGFSYIDIEKKYQIFNIFAKYYHYTLDFSETSVINDIGSISNLVPDLLKLLNSPMYNLLNFNLWAISIFIILIGLYSRLPGVIEGLFKLLNKYYKNKNLKINLEVDKYAKEYINQCINKSKYFLLIVSVYVFSSLIIDYYQRWDDVMYLWNMIWDKNIEERNINPLRPITKFWIAFLGSFTCLFVKYNKHGFKSWITWLGLVGVISSLIAPIVYFNSDWFMKFIPIIGSIIISLVFFFSEISFSLPIIPLRKINTRIINSVKMNRKYLLGGGSPLAGNGGQNADDSTGNGGNESTNPQDQSNPRNEANRRNYRRNQVNRINNRYHPYSSSGRPNTVQNSSNTSNHTQNIFNAFNLTQNPSNTFNHTQNPSNTSNHTQNTPNTLNQINNYPENINYDLYPSQRILPIPLNNSASHFRYVPSSIYKNKFMPSNTRYFDDPTSPDFDWDSEGNPRPEFKLTYLGRVRYADIRKEWRADMAELKEIKAKKLKDEQLGELWRAGARKFLEEVRNPNKNLYDNNAGNISDPNKFPNNRRRTPTPPPPSVSIVFPLVFSSKNIENLRIIPNQLMKENNLDLSCMNEEKYSGLLNLLINNIKEILMMLQPWMLVIIIVTSFITFCLILFNGYINIKLFFGINQSNDSNIKEDKAINEKIEVLTEIFNVLMFILFIIMILSAWDALGLNWNFFNIGDKDINMDNDLKKDIISEKNMNYLRWFLLIPLLHVSNLYKNFKMYGFKKIRTWLSFFSLIFSIIIIIYRSNIQMYWFIFALIFFIMIPLFEMIFPFLSIFIIGDLLIFDLVFIKVMLNKCLKQFTLLLIKFNNYLGKGVSRMIATLPGLHTISSDNVNRPTEINGNQISNSQNSVSTSNNVSNRLSIANLLNYPNTVNVLIPFEYVGDDNYSPCLKNLCRINPFLSEILTDLPEPVVRFFEECFSGLKIEAYMYVNAVTRPEMKKLVHGLGYIGTKDINVRRILYCDTLYSGRAVNRVSGGLPNAYMPVPKVMGVLVNPPHAELDWIRIKCEITRYMTNFVKKYYPEYKDIFQKRQTKYTELLAELNKPHVSARDYMRKLLVRLAGKIARGENLTVEEEAVVRVCKKHVKWMEDAHNRRFKLKRSITSQFNAVFNQMTPAEQQVFWGSR